jgi:pyruvate dehydrogenase E2 component (dihydrolipoamide acetyltransferase)
MSTEVLVPPLGQTVDSLTLVSWYKQANETVTQGEPLFAVETDKATLDVEAPASGVLRNVTAAPGDTVKVLSVIAGIEVEDEAEAELFLASASSSALTSASAITSSSASTSSSRLFISPRARRLAEGEGVDPAHVRPTGPQGAIVERDVRAYLQGSGGRGQESGVTGSAPQAAGGISPVARRIAEDAGVDWQAIAGTGPRGQITREDVVAALEQRSRGAEGQRGGGAEVSGQLPATTPAEPAVQLPASSFPLPASRFQLPASSFPFTGIRALIAGRMVAGHGQTAPVTLTAEADATALVELRQKLAADGVAVSYNDLFLTILAKALAEHPRLNASLDGDTVKLWPQMDIAVAVDTERGLLAPAVRGVDRKGLAQLAAETASLAERARAGKCTPDELTGSTFTLTNLGMYGIDAFTPIINLPECAILGVGRIKPQPAWIGDHAEPRQMVWLSLTFDHRLVDGGPAARFLQRVAQLVEKPHLLMA